MLKRLSLAIAAVLLVFMLISVANAQSSDTYWLNYYTNPTGAPTTQVRIVNPGVQGAPVNPATGLVSTAGYLCANVYMFDAHQELIECCSCPISPNGLLTFSVQANLLANPLTPAVPSTGVIKLVSSAPISVTPNGVSPTSATAVCDAGEIGPAPEVLTPDLRAWITHAQVVPAGFAITEARLVDAPLSGAESAFLPLACQMARYLGSGFGQCTCPGTT